MKKKLLPILGVSCILLAGCSYGAPEEILDYLDNCTYQKAREWVQNATLTFELKEVKREDESVVVGTRKVRYLVDFSNTLSYYSLRFEEFTGNARRDVDGDDVLDDSYRLINHVDSGDTNKYICNRRVNGSVIEDLEMTYSVMEGTVTSFFYTSSTDSVYYNGMYYADSMQTSLKYHRYMSIDENNNFVYSVQNVGTLDENDKLVSSTSETFYMNTYGMLFHFEQEVINLIASTKTTSTLQIDYNKSDFARVLDINHTFE